MTNAVHEQDWDAENTAQVRADRSHQRTREQKRWDAWRDSLPWDHPDKLTDVMVEGADSMMGAL